MTGLTQYTAKNALAWATGKTSMPALPTVYAALFTAVGTDSGAGFTEVTGGSYARVATAAADWNAPTGANPSYTTNANAITFPTSTASWGTVLAIGLYDAATGGNLLAWDWIGQSPWFPFSCTAAAPGVFSAPGITAGSTPNLANGDIVIVNDEFGGTLPGGLADATQYTVAGLSTDTFNVGTTTTTAGDGMVKKVVPVAVGTSVQPSFAAGAIKLTLT